uniref:Uncharacterized protein n=1 Tax=Oscillatoriales cyanobacterium SpSt-402 TaxID=2282168 RepID=A0A832M1N4_9CYAN
MDCFAVPRLSSKTPFGSPKVEPVYIDLSTVLRYGDSPTSILLATALLVGAITKLVQAAASSKS